MRRLTVALAIIAAALACVPSTSASSPTDEVLRRANAALQVLEGRDFVGSYVLSAHVRVSAPGEDGPEDSLEVEEVTFHPDGTRESRLVRAVEDGRDVTRERLARGEGHEPARAHHDDHADVDTGLLPLGAQADRYVFAAAKKRGGLMVAAFRPVTRTSGEEDMQGRGELAWDPATGDPAWITVEPVDAPPFVSRLELRFEFARSAGVLYPKLVHTSTRAGIPLILRVKVDVDIEVSDVRPATAPPERGEAL